VTDRWDAVAALSDGSRRTLYDYVRRQSHPVAREEAAEATGMSRGLAAFHLDKLVEAGLLAARYEAPAGQPRGRGRAPKVYEAAGDGLTITVPERRYELIAGILADAVADSPAQADQAALVLAFQRGQDIGTRMRAAGTDVVAVLAGLGFEPHADAGRVLLHNCPFHALAGRQTALVCGLNHRFVTGVLDGLGATDSEAMLVPRPGACCVEITAGRSLPCGQSADPVSRSAS
jgi:predicted ArsR family transcriptional regulator